MFKRTQLVLAVMLLAGSILNAQVLIGLNNIAGTYYHGWQLYDFDGSYIPNSEARAHLSSASVPRYMAGWAIKHGEGMDEVTARVIRDDKDNQAQYLRVYSVSTGALISAWSTTANGFGMSSTRIGHGGTYMDDANSVAAPNVFNPVYAYANNKKPGTSHFQYGFGVIMDGDLGTGIDFSYYEFTNSARHLVGMAYDPETKLAYLSAVRYDNGARDDIWVLDASVTPWSRIALGAVSQAWGNTSHIMDMSMGPDYNGDGSYDLYVAVANDANDAQGGYNNGYNFWTVLDTEIGDWIDPCNTSLGRQLIVSQISDPFTIAPEAGKVYGIALDMYQSIPATCSYLIASRQGLSNDFNEDCRVDLQDWAMMEPESPLIEIAQLASQWLMCLETDEPATGCH